MLKIPQIEPLLGDEERAELLRTLDSGFVTEAKKTREFEAEMAEFLAAPYICATNNCTLAISIALMSLGIGPGDEVIVPDFTFIATANGVKLAGALPVFADITRDTFVLDLTALEGHITPRTKAILPVHLNGRGPDMQALADLARRRGLFVVEDAAQALGSKQNGRYLGTLGEVGTFSLGTTKIITTGQGGLVATHRKDLYENCIRLKDHGRLSRSAEVHDTVGFNFKFTDLQAALGLAQLRKMPERVEQKKRLFRWYGERLRGVTGLLVPPMDLNQNVPWFVDVLCEERDSLHNYLAAECIDTRPFYLPVHSQPCYRASGDFPNSEYVTRRGLWLPSSLTLTQQDVDFICAKIRAWAEEGRRSRQPAPVTQDAV